MNVGTFGLHWGGAARAQSFFPGAGEFLAGPRSPGLRTEIAFGSHIPHLRDTSDPQGKMNVCFYD